MKKFGAIAFGCCLIWTNILCVSTTSSQVQESQESIDMRSIASAWEALLRLRSTATVLHTTAHPDDEDGALLTYLSRGEGVRTGLLTLNRGEGGANLIGPELSDALGLLRTEELLAASRYYNVDQFFTHVVDFGFSKRMDETLDKWGRENVLRDVVRAVRLYRPDVIVSRFQGTPRDGHGNHQTAGLISREVFRAAANPNRFPEQLAEGIRPWQVKKLYIETRESEPYTLRVEVSRYDPLLGGTYREIGRRGLSFQRSQGAGQVRVSPGTAFSYMQLVETTIPKVENKGGLFEGLDTTIVGMGKLAGESVNLVPELTIIQEQVEKALNAFDARRPWLVMPYLANGLATTRAVIEKARSARIEEANKDQLLFLLANKEREFVEAGNRALGLSMEVIVDPEKPVDSSSPFAQFQPRTTFAVATPGQHFTLTATVSNPSEIKIDTVNITLRTPAGWRASALGQKVASRGENEQSRMQFQVEIPGDAKYTRPYFSRASEYTDNLYTIEGQENLNLPFSPPEVIGVFTYRVNNVLFTLIRPAQTVFVDPILGEQRRLLTVAPALSLSVVPTLGIIPVMETKSTFTIRVSVTNNDKEEAKGRLHLNVPKGWTVTPAETSFAFTREGEIQAFPFLVSIPKIEAGAHYTVQAVTESKGKRYTEGYQTIMHRDNEPRHLYRPAIVELRGVDVKVAPKLKLGYVMGVGDQVPQALEQIGINAQILGAEDLARGNLDQFDVVMIGIRAYAVRDDLKAHNQRLLDYVEKGGNLIVQYQTQEFDVSSFAPYPYKVGERAEEVSEEDAAVTILEPSNTIFNWPNRIIASDFTDWVEERGSKFMTNWDARYKPLLECHDQGQEPQRGGLLQAQYGRGTYTYAAYALYRQLPAGVGGGYRLLANMISLRKQSAKEEQ